MERAAKGRSNKDSDLRLSAGAREQIGDQLKTFYERCMTTELPARLREALKKLEDNRPNDEDE